MGMNGRFVCVCGRVAWALRGANARQAAAALALSNKVAHPGGSSGSRVFFGRHVAPLPSRSVFLFLGSRGLL